MAFSVRQSVTIVFASLLMGVGGCANDAQTGAAIGAGIGAIAGQAIGGDTEGTLIGAAVGAGAGYVIGNERDKAAAQNAQATGGTSTSQPTSVEPRRETVAAAPPASPAQEANGALAGTSWNVVSLTGDPAPERYASIVVHFRSGTALNTVVTYSDGRVESSNERYVLDGERITIWGDAYRIDGTYRLEGDVIIVNAPDFRAIGERLGG